MPAKDDNVPPPFIKNPDSSSLASETNPDRYRSATLLNGFCFLNQYIWCDFPGCLGCSASYQFFCCTTEVCLNHQLKPFGCGKQQDEFSAFDCLFLECQRFKYGCQICAVGCAPSTGCCKSMQQCCCYGKTRRHFYL